MALKVAIPRDNANCLTVFSVPEAIPLCFAFTDDMIVVPLAGIVSGIPKPNANKPKTSHSYFPVLAVAAIQIKPIKINNDPNMAGPRGPDLSRQAPPIVGIKIKVSVA